MASINLKVNPAYQSYYNLNSGSKLEFSFTSEWGYDYLVDPTTGSHDPKDLPNLIYASQNFTTSKYDDATKTVTQTTYNKEFFAAISYTKGSSWQIAVSTGYRISELNEDGAVKNVLVEPTWEAPVALEGQSGITENEKISVELSFSENRVDVNIIQYDISTTAENTFTFYQDFTNEYDPLFFSFCSGITFGQNASNGSIFPGKLDLNYYYVFNNNIGDIVGELSKNSSNLLPYAYLQIPFENISSFYPLSTNRLNTVNSSEFLYRKSVVSGLEAEDYFNAGMLLIDPSKATYSMPFNTAAVSGKNYVTLSFWQSLNIDRLTYNDEATKFDDVTMFELVDTANKTSIFSCSFHIDDSDTSNILYQTLLKYKDSTGVEKTLTSDYTSQEPLFVSLSFDVVNKELSLSLLNSAATEGIMVENTAIFPVNLTSTTSIVFGDSINNLSYSGPLLSLYSISVFNNCHFYNGILNMPSWGTNFVPQNSSGAATHYSLAMLYLLYGGASSSFEDLYSNYLIHKQEKAVL